jgi:uncharacterized protein (TIGR03086 family)
MELLDALSQTFDHTSKIVGGVHDDQLGLSTPCRQWDVRTLLSHTIGVVANVGRGASGQGLLADVNSFPLEADLGAQFRAVADLTLGAWTARGPEGEVNIGPGPMPLEAAIGINLLDTATHSWDIARATGQDGSLPDELAATVLAVSRAVVTDNIRGFGRFDPAVPVSPDASPTDQLVAFLGRRP